MKKKPDSKNQKSHSALIEEAEVLIDDLNRLTRKAELSYVVPVRKSIIKRFPVLFMLLVSFGVAATFLGLEKMITQYEILNNSPEFIFLLGITILVFTGKLYKKLG